MGVHSSQLDFSQLRPHSKHFQHEGYVHRSVGRLRHGFAEETVDQSADEQFFHTYGYYPTAYTYSAPVAVKTAKYAAPTVKYVAPTVKTVQYAAPYAYQYGAYPYAAAYQPYAVKSLLPATYGAYPYGA